MALARIPSRCCQAKNGQVRTSITAGVDVGSVGSKAAIMVNGEAYSWGITRTGSNSPESANKALGLALEGTGLKSVTSNTLSAQATGELTFQWQTRPLRKSPATLKAQIIFGDQACEPCWMLEDKTSKPSAAMKQAELSLS